MTPSSDRRLKPTSHQTVARRRWPAALIVVALLCCAVPIQSSSVREAAPLSIHVTESAGLTPFLNIIPTSDGELWIHAGGTGQLAGTVYANLDIGAGHHKGGWTMTYSDTLRGYVNLETVVSLTSAQDDYGSLSITTTHGLDSGPIHYERYYVPLATPRTLPWPDGAFEVDLVSGDTFSTATYLAVSPSWGLPKAVPAGHRLVSEVYTLRASGAQQETNRPMLLRLYPQNDLLGAADPHTLAVFRWDAHENRWTNLGGTLFSAQGYMSAGTTRLNSYALMSTPAWKDAFDDHTGLSERSHVDWGGTAEDLALVLFGTEQTGYAVSVPISAPMGTRWDSLSYTAAVALATQSLTVDLLHTDGRLVRSNVSDGADLSDLETAQVPALKLRANFSSTVAGESPMLYDWQVAWRAASFTRYLPLVETYP